MAGVDPRLGYVPTGPLQQTTPEGSEIIWLKTPMRPGEGEGPAFPIPKSHVAAYLSKGYQPVTEEDLKIQRYAAEKLTTSQKVISQMGEYAPGFGVVQHLLDSGMTDEEKALRKEAANRYMTGPEKFFTRGIPAAVEFAVTGGVEGAVVKAGMSSVKAAAAVGAGQGALAATQMYLDDPKVSGAAMATTMVASTLFSAGGQKLLNKVIPKGDASKWTKLATSGDAEMVEKADNVAYEMLQKAGVSADEIEKRFASTPGAARDYALKAINEGLIQPDANSARKKLFDMRKGAKATFNEIEAVAQESGGTISATSIGKQLEDMRIGLMASDPEKRKLINRTVGELAEGLSERGDMDFKTFREYKKTIQKEMVVAKRAMENGSTAGQVKYDLYEGLRKNLDDIENRFIADMDPSGALAPRWAKAQEQWSLNENFTEAMNTRMAQELSRAQGRFSDGMINQALSVFYAATGNWAGLGFNAVHAVSQQLQKRAMNPVRMAAMLDSSMESGLTKRVAAATYSKIREKAIMASGPVAKQLGYVVEDLEQESEDAKVRSDFLRSYTQDMATLLQQEFNDPASYERYVGLVSNLATQGTDMGLAGIAQLNRIKGAVSKHLPGAAMPMLLDAMGEEKIEMSDMDTEKTYEVLQAILQPTDALANPTALQVQVMHEAYPEYMGFYRQQLMKDLVQANTKGIKFSLEDKERYNTILQISSSVENDKQFISRIQAFLKAKGEMNDQPQPPRSPSASNFGKSSVKNATTTNERVSGL